jgi:Right handed beta helix region
MSPIILQSAAGRGHVIFEADMNIYDVKYLYLIGLHISPQGDALHCERCDFLLLKNMILDGGNQLAQETLKINQSQNIFIEDSEIFGAHDNAVDFVAVQYGHILRTKIHNANDWCVYTKGGSAYLTIESNEIYNCGTGGYTAGQGSGFEFMTSPWLHYEAYDIKFFNNTIHDTEGAGFGVNGGYNILLAHNSLYRVGSRSHAIEVVFGYRSCDGNAFECLIRNQLGGWGPTSVNTEENPIPNKNVYIYNNLIYNPAPFRSADQHFAIYAPRIPEIGLNIPSPSTTDQNLQIKGNLIWNGTQDMPLGIEDENGGCLRENPSCNISQLVSENTINRTEPSLQNPESDNFRPSLNSNIFNARGEPIPSFPGGDRETTPLASQGILENTISYDKDGNPRVPNNIIIGAYINSDSISPIPPDSIPRDTIFPIITKASKSSTKIKKGKKLTISAKITDDVFVQNVWAQVGDNLFNLRKGKKDKYSGTAKINSPRGKQSVFLYATDSSNNTSVKSLGLLTIK